MTPAELVAEVRRLYEAAKRGVPHASVYDRVPQLCDALEKAEAEKAELHAAAVQLWECLARHRFRLELSLREEEALNDELGEACAELSASQAECERLRAELEEAKRDR